MPIPPGLRFSITSPAKDAIVGRTVTVSGRAWTVGDLGFTVREVRVAFGGGTEQTAALSGHFGDWSCAVTTLPGWQGGTRLRIVARPYGVETDGVDVVPVGQPDTVDVVLDSTVPDFVTIDSFTTPVTTPSNEYVLDLSGTAGDAQTGISKVRLKVDDGPFVEVADLVETTDTGTGRHVWLWKQKTVKIRTDVQGVHRFTAQAEDGAGNTIERTAEIVVRKPVDPGPVEHVFEPTRYLHDLLEFAHRYVAVAGSLGDLTTRMLVDRFHQPFDRLTDPALFVQATSSLPQARIAVEVLRGRLGTPPPPDLDQRFRGLAYRTFLRGLGTSYEELRLARTADPSTREALAGRLGIPPHRLDALAASPDAITDDQLESLSGYRSTALADPLGSGNREADVLLWRRDTVHLRWRDEDEVQRDSFDNPRPIIDPDLVSEGHLRTRQQSDPAYALWTSRRTWLADKLAEIEHAHVGLDLAGLDTLVSGFIGMIDIQGLAAQDADGTDVRPALLQGLTLDAFRFLARSRALLAEGTSLDTEWSDIVSILLQVQKRRQYQSWRTEEKQASLVLEPAYFTLDAAGATHPAAVSRWRFQPSEYVLWRKTLAARVAAMSALVTGYQRVVDATEAAVLPQLRDALIVEMATPGDTADATAERLTRELMIDLLADAGQLTTRVDQALETLHGALFTARAGRLGADSSGRVWTIDLTRTPVREFDREWQWMGSLRGWLSATRIFAYPENQLFPALYVADSGFEAPTASYRTLIDDLRKESSLTPEAARRLADSYVKELVDHGVVGADFTLTDRLSDADLVSLQQLSTDLRSFPHQREVFWLAPMAIAAKLQESGQYQAAIDWYRRVYAYHLPAEHRRIYHGLTVEDKPSSYGRALEWLLKELNPHLFALDRRNCYTKATIMAIAGCFNAFADAEFSRGTPDGNTRARTLYETAIELLDLPEAQPETGDHVPFPTNPVWQSMRDHSRSGLAKIHRGLNIAGVATGTGYESTLPSQYRFSVLLERAKNLVALAQQVETAYLAALEQQDVKAYDELRARNDLEVAGATVTLHVTKVAEAATGMRLANLQRERAQLQENHFDDLIQSGPNFYEQAALGALGVSAVLHGLAGAASAFSLFGVAKNNADALSEAATVASTLGQAAELQASFERREQEWELQRDLAGKDVAIGDQQLVLADTQYKLANQEFQLALLQQDHAVAVADFLATRFTSAELFEWMSGVLGRVYAFFLRQATALARLAEAQLAFERQELPAGFVSSDYWRDATTGASDRRGLTGSARLLEDVARLDQYAFDTDRRKLHLTQTFSLSQVAAFELQHFRETGVLTFATPQELFDRDFPGHYLRLIKKVQLDMIALIPRNRGVRATLSASGVSRTVVARGPFDTVALRREPESIAFTSPTNATGLFNLEPEGGLLLPFEGMGVDTVWQLELPKAANPFDYRSIADVLLTIEYTALDSVEYRERVVRDLDRRFSGDRTFSVRNQFPDAWYELNNPETVEPERRMRAVLPLTADDFPPHVQDLRVEEISLFAVRADELADELTVTSLGHTSGGQTVTAAEVSTTGGIISTRRPAGAPWQVLRSRNPVGTWELRLLDDELVRSWFRDGLVEDLVLVLTLAGTTPAWP
jgi:Tc toxin complex TcA C-terminal TcB-binding domain